MEGRDGFYVEPNCCLLCGVPEDIAPELFETGEKQCFVKRQPCSQHEVDRAIKAMWSGEVDCMRYAGSDLPLLRRIGEANMSGQADDFRAATFTPVLRDRVTFEMPTRTRPAALAGMFAADERARGSKVIPRLPGSRTVYLAWFEWRFHKVRFRHWEDGKLLISVRSFAIPGLCFRVDEWLRKQGAHSIIWHSVAGVGIDSRDTPI